MELGADLRTAYTWHDRCAHCCRAAHEGAHRAGCVLSRHHAFLITISSFSEPYKQKAYKYRLQNYS